MLKNNKLRKISIDFDKCLTEPTVQVLVRQLIKEGHEVFITTARWPDPLTHLWGPGETNQDLYKVMDEIGLDRTKVIFTSTNNKADFLIKAKVDIHLDDNKDQIFWSRLAGVKCINVTEGDWLQEFNKLLKAPKYNIKLLICGHARHGKDTVADLLCEFAGLTSTSSSWAVADLFFREFKDKYNYKSVEECYEDRVNRRKEWYDFICDYNREDKTRLTKKILETSNIYVGLRSPEELAEARTLFDLILWVDASERLPLESEESNGITKDMCDIIIENNGTYQDLVRRVEKLSYSLKLSTETAQKVFS